MFKVKRSEKEINDVINKASDNLDIGKSQWPRLSYEDGVYISLQWVFGWYESNPMEDE